MIEVNYHYAPKFQILVNYYSRRSPADQLSDLYGEVSTSSYITLSYPAFTFSRWPS